MTLDELIEELGASARITRDDYYPTRKLFLIEKRFGRGAVADDMTKETIVDLVRQIRNDTLLWCDDVIAWARD